MIYNGKSNSKIRCVDQHNSQVTCQEGFIVYYSLAGRVSKDSYKLSSTLNIIFVLLALIGAFVYRKIQAMIAKDIDKKTITASDYTVMVSGLPKGEQASDIEAFFEKAVKKKEGIAAADEESRAAKRVVKVNMAYKIGRIVSLGRKKQRLEAKSKRKKKEDAKLEGIKIELELYERQIADGSAEKHQLDKNKNPLVIRRRKKARVFKTMILISHINQYVKLIKRKRYFDKAIGLAKRRNNKNETLEDQIQNFESQIYNPLTKFTGIAFVTFTEEDGSYLLVIFRNIFRCTVYHQDF